MHSAICIMWCVHSVALAALVTSPDLPTTAKLSGTQENRAVLHWRAHEPAVLQALASAVPVQSFPPGPPASQETQTGRRRMGSRAAPAKPAPPARPSHCGYVLQCITSIGLTRYAGPVRFEPSTIEGHLRRAPFATEWRATQWFEDRQAKLLNPQYFDVVFTLPEQIAAMPNGSFIPSGRAAAGPRLRGPTTAFSPRTMVRFAPAGRAIATPDAGGHDPNGRGIHPPVPAPCPASWLSTHPVYGFLCNRQPQEKTRALPRVARHPPSFSRRPVNRPVTTAIGTRQLPELRSTNATSAATYTWFSWN